MGSRTFWGRDELENAMGKNSAREGFGQKYTSNFADLLKGGLDDVWQTLTRKNARSSSGV